jgi:hypothetical protein
MRTTGKVMMMAAAALSIALTGCSGSTTGASPGASASGSPGASGAAGVSGGGGSTGGSGKTAACVVGTWKSTSLAGTLSGNGVNGTLTGGGGVVLTIAKDGKTTVTFDGMQPVGFTFKVAGGDVRGAFAYGGKVNGTLTMPSSSATSGTWEPTGTVDFSALNVTVDILSPTSVRVADKLPLAQFVGSGQTDASNAVDGQPILKKSTYKCSGNTLQLGPPAGNTGTGTWTLTKS